MSAQKIVINGDHRSTGAFRRVLSYVTKYWQLKAVMVIIVLSTVIDVLSPAIIGSIIDIVSDVAAGGEIQQFEGFGSGVFGVLSRLASLLTSISGVGINRATLLVFSLSLIVISALTGFFNYVQRYASTYVSQKASLDLRNDLYNSLLDQSFSFYDKQRTGQLMARATGDISQLERFFTFGFRMLISSCLLTLLVVYSLLTIDFKLTLVSVIVLPFLLFTFRNFVTKIRPLYDENREQYGVLTSVIQENLTGIRVVRGFSQEPYEEAKFSMECKKYFDINLDMAKIRALYLPLATFVSSLGFVFIIWYGGNLVIDGVLSLGSLVAFYFYLARLMRPVRMVGMLSSMVVRASAAAQRVFNIVDAEVEVSDRRDALNLEKIEGWISFEDVWFSYDGKNMVLKGISFDVKPGETIAVLGATGSGKSSIMNLIPRFYDTSKGAIKIDGVNIRDVSLKSLRQHVGIVRQDPFIFSTTLRENIAFGVGTVNLEEVKKAAERAKIHEFIVSLPNGYKTEVGERGVTLSGGQRQRVAIARALLKNPKILILDDSTSSVDMQTEYEIQQSLDELLIDRTTFIITQRLSSVKKADNILVLENGIIVEQGSHEELMEVDGIYRKLYETQISGDLDRRRG